ncbi:hypothetical protein Tco_0159250 [Tanacetum coccineum]
MTTSCTHSKKAITTDFAFKTIEDILLLLVQCKLTNLNIEERLALGVSLRMFTRSIIIKRRVEDLQLGIKSYQKKLNLTKPDTYRSDLKRKTPYTAYSNPKGFIYQIKTRKHMFKYDNSTSLVTEQKVNEEPGKIHWWETVDPHGFEGYLKMEVKLKGKYCIQEIKPRSLGIQLEFGKASKGKSLEFIGFAFGKPALRLTLSPKILTYDEQKKQLGKNNEAKMTLYNALPCKEYERVFMCKTTKEIWHILIITHQGNLQVKNCKIDIFTQEYKKFSISNKETINSGLTRFNDIVTSLKSLDLDDFSKNHVRKFIRALPLKWRAKVTAIEEAKYLAILPLDELVGNLKVYEIILENDSVASKTITKEKVKSLALKAKVTREQTSDDSDSQGGSDEDIDEEEGEAFNLMDRNF